MKDGDNERLFTKSVENSQGNKKLFLWVNMQNKL